MSAAQVDLLSIGECMVEFSDAASGASGPELGGDSLNTLAMAVRTGVSGAYLTRVGGNEYRAFVLEKCRGWGIDTRLAKIDQERRNGRYRIEIDARGERSFRYDRAGSAASALSEADLDAAEIRAARMVFASGISQAISPSAAAAVEKAARLAREAGVPFAYDVNFRPALWTEGEAVAALARLLSRPRAYIDTLFCSEADFPVLAKAAGILTGDPARLMEAAWSAGVSTVVLKRGSRAVWAGERVSRDVWSALPPEVTVRDTTAAGDSFNGAFLSARLRGESLLEALRLATAASALTVTRPGSIAAMPSRAEAEAARAQVATQRL